MNKKDSFFITDDRYLETARQQVPSFFEVISEKNSENRYVIISKFATKIENLGIMASAISFEDAVLVKKALGKPKFVPVDKFVKDLREIKSLHEISLIKKAVGICECALERTIAEIKPGVRENELKASFIYHSLNGGADNVAFDTIVVSGKGTSVPHATTGTKKIAPKDIIMFDCGVKYKGYCNDMTRMFFIGEPPLKIKKMYTIVEKALKMSEEFIKLGRATDLAYENVVNFFKSHEMEKNFLHSLGHGVGIEVHESPSIGRKKSLFKENQVFTIEPGLYFDNFGGIRLENMYFIDSKGNVNNLNKMPIDVKVI